MFPCFHYILDLVALGSKEHVPLLSWCHPKSTIGSDEFNRFGERLEIDLWKEMKNPSLVGNFMH